jgi:hypothetical protein
MHATRQRAIEAEFGAAARTRWFAGAGFRPGAKVSAQR